MIIWLLLIIPIITIAFLIYNYHHKVVWWEYLVHLGVAILLIVVMKVIGEKSLTNDTEYWGDLIERVEYYEFYSIWDHEICTRQVPCGTDAKGNMKYCTQTYDCSHLDTHPAHWEVITTTGWKFSISEQDYLDLVARFQATPQFQDMHRERECGLGDHVVKDGNMHYAVWSGTKETSFSVSWTQHYENKVQASNSVFNYQNVSPEEAKEQGLFDYPDFNKKTGWFNGPSLQSHCIPTILGGEKVDSLSQAENKFHFLNGDLGPKKELRVWILLFENKPLSVATLQESYWKGGNQNEFVVCIGINSSQEVQWCYPFSWTEITELKVNTRNFVIDQNKLNLTQLADYLYRELSDKWIRKEFKDFSYLTIDPPGWAIWISFIVQICFNIGFSIWSVRNDFENE
ncbi:MAG: hypothetical protein LBP53_04405 [Candidatus Peribacteria bacterium]|jgi:hypothetical protein|nr:hypothetical protein [Candidatus Peribacteria bacterium]